MLCKKLEVCDFGLASRITKLKKCSRCPENVAAKVAKIREVAPVKFEGLCLDCTKSPRKSPEQRLNVASRTSISEDYHGSLQS